MARCHLVAAVLTHHRSHLKSSKLFHMGKNHQGSFNGEHVHPLPTTREDELGVNFQTTDDAANTAAGSGLHDADCWLNYLRLAP